MSSTEIVSPKRMRSYTTRTSGVGKTAAACNASAAVAGERCPSEPLGYASQVREDDERSQALYETLRTRLMENDTKSGIKSIQKKTVITHGIQKNQKPKLKNKFASPTDRLLSPCSQKLNEHKSKLFVSKSNPTKLSFARKQALDESLGGDEDTEYN